MIKWAVSIGLHAVWLCVFLYLWNSGGIGDLNYDSLSMSLSILQTLLAVFAFVGFGYVAILADRAARSTAEEVAKKTAQATARAAAAKIARETAESVVKSELPAILRREALDQVKTTNVLGDEVPAKIEQAAVNSLDGDEK